MQAKAAGMAQPHPVTAQGVAYLFGLRGALAVGLSTTEM